MFRKIHKSFVILTLSGLFLSSNLLASDEKETGTIKNNMTPEALKTMSQEDLIKLLLKQQEREIKLQEKISSQEKILDGMSETEKQVELILNTPISQNAAYLIKALTVSEAKKISLDSALCELIKEEESSPDNRVDFETHLKEISEDVLGKEEPLKLPTIRQILEDKNGVSEDIARKLFRGVLCTIENEEGLLNLGKLCFGNEDEVDQVVRYLSQSYHLIKLMYFEDGVTDHLINKYLSIRKSGAMITKLRSKPIKFCMF